MTEMDCPTILRKKNLDFALKSESASQQSKVEPMIRDSYWIIGASHSYKISYPLQIRFDKRNAEALLESINNIFGTSYSL